MGKSNLRLDWATHEAARYAVETWHYSGTMPAGKTCKVGVWEDGRFVGVVIFSMGAAPQAHCPFGIGPTQICELTRVALSRHKCAVSRVLAISQQMMQKANPGIRLVVSYADPEQDHVGGIYQAAGWIYAGRTAPAEHFEFVSSGRRIHSKSLKTGRRGYATQLKGQGIIRSIRTWKHKYLMPLDAEMRQQILPLARPYPKRASSADSGTPGVQPGGGGASPTDALQTSAAG